MNHIEIAKAGRLVLSLRCRRRGHSLGAIYATAEGVIVISRYDSGRRTRRIAGTVLPTIKFLTETAWFLDDGYPADFRGRAQTATVRCACTEGELDVSLLRIAIADGRRVVSIDAVRSGIV